MSHVPLSLPPSYLIWLPPLHYVWCPLHLMELIHIRGETVGTFKGSSREHLEETFFSRSKLVLSAKPYHWVVPLVKFTSDISWGCLTAAPELPESRAPTCQRNNISVFNFASNTAMLGCKDNFHRLHQIVSLDPCEIWNLWPFKQWCFGSSWGDKNGMWELGCKNLMCSTLC